MVTKKANTTHPILAIHTTTAWHEETSAEPVLFIVNAMTSHQIANQPVKRHKHKKTRKERHSPDKRMPLRDTEWANELAQLKIEARNFKPPIDIFAKNITNADRIKLAKSMPYRILRGWRFQMSTDPTLGRYHLSMSLHPSGRNSTEEDWGFMGMAHAALGVPLKLEPLGGWPHPNAVHHFLWPLPASEIITP